MNNRKKNGNGNGHKNGNGGNGIEKATVQSPKTENITKAVKGNIAIIDSNIAIYQPSFIKESRVDGNLLVIPWTVLFELNNLKTRPVIGFDAREAIRLIDKAVDDGDTDLVIETSTEFLNLNLDKKNPDHQIIACVNSVWKKFNQKDSLYYGYQKIKFISNDSIVRIISKTLFRKHNISIEPLLRDRIKRVSKPSVRSITLKSSKDITTYLDGLCLPYRASYHLKENEAAIFISKFDLTQKIDFEESKARFLGVRKGNIVKLVSPGIKLYGHLPLSNGRINWSQVAAMNLLTDPDIHATFLQGPAGTGKTFLALAAALELYKTKKVSDIIVSRVTEPMDRSQAIGLLPGGVEAKMAPWVLPIVQNLSRICPNKMPAIKNGYDERNISFIESFGISIQPLDYIRGTSFSNTLIIIEEAQNLTPHQIKTLITRAGKGTKIIFTGDLSQIEEGTKLDVNSSGLTYAISRLNGYGIIGIVVFEDVVRSVLAQLAEKVL